MNQTIQFETIVEGDIIRIPEQYILEFPSTVKVTVVPVKHPQRKIKLKAKTGPFSSGDFTALSIDAQGWRFDREEANERC